MDYFESGFTVRERSWHGKETLLAEAPENWDDARMAAGLMWEPRLTPLYRATRGALVHPTYYVRNEDGSYTEVDGVMAVEEADGAKQVERDDTGAPLGVVSDRFELISHGEMGTIIETILEDKAAKFDTAGSVREGKMVYATMLLDEPYAIKGDIDGFGDQVLTLPYFALLNSHDGAGACKGLYTQVRVVCANTVQAADADGDRHGAQFIIRHTTGAKNRIEEAANVIKGARAEALRWQGMAEALALMPVTKEQQMMYLSEFIPEPPAGVTSDRVREHVARDRERFLHTLNNSATNSAMSETALGLVNASIEYLDHVRGFQSQNTYMGRQILRAEPLKAKAIKLVRELVSV
jgi:phage/plasmid-like protein (TIGR03299 family)